MRGGGVFHACLRMLEIILALDTFGKSGSIERLASKKKKMKKKKRTKKKKMKKNHKKNCFTRHVRD